MKSFDGTPVLKGVDFHLKRGEVHAIVGQNGAGKSTLMKILNGVYQKDGGEVSLFGKSCHFQSAKEAREAGISMVYQDLSLISTLTVAENIFLQGAFVQKGFFIDQKKQAEETIKLLELIGVDREIAPNATVEELSVGQQQLVEIAKALSSNSGILILDEPTASLSNAEIEKLFAVIGRLKSKGIAIIYITHYLKDIFRICDSVSVLRDGKCTIRVATKQTDLKELVREMLGKKELHTLQEKRTDRKVQDKQTPILELKEVTTDRVHNISLKLYPGEIVGLAGLLGSGRTEILEAIFGLDRVLSGEILINGIAIDFHSPQDAIEQGITLVPEERRRQGLILDSSVEENTLLSIYDRLQKHFLLQKRKGEAIVDRFIEHLNVKTAGKTQDVRYLSGGNQQKVVIAKCFSTDARILLLDDPTFGIDLNSKYEIMNIVREYVEQGNAVLFVSSEYGEIANFCDRIYVVNRDGVSPLPEEATVTEDDLLELVQ